MVNRIIIDVLFWLHILVIFLGVLMGLFLPLYLVLALVMLHRMQFFIFNDCLLSKLQKRVQGLRQNEHFLQFAVRKISNKKISRQRAKQLDYVLASSSVIIAVVNNSLILIF